MKYLLFAYGYPVLERLKGQKVALTTLRWLCYGWTAFSAFAIASWLIVVKSGFNPPA